MIRKALARLYICAFIAPLAPFATIAWLGEWINEWKWPYRYAEACERFGKRIGLDMS